MNNLYKTSDFLTASVLVCLKFPLDSLDRNNPRRVEFCFDDSEDLQIAVKKVFRGEIKVEPREFAMAQKTLKSFLYDST